MRKEEKVPGFKLTYCPRCEGPTAHDLYTSEGGYLHSLCTDCGKDVDSRSVLSRIDGEASKPCRECGTTTEHVRYISKGGYIHWFCCSCGKDVESKSVQG